MKKKTRNPVHPVRLRRDQQVYAPPETLNRCCKPKDRVKRQVSNKAPQEVVGIVSAGPAHPCSELTPPEILPMGVTRVSITMAHS